MSTARVYRTTSNSIDAFDDPHAKMPTPRPHNQATADSVILGRDLDSSETRPPSASHPEADALRSEGAAGQFTPREAAPRKAAAPPPLHTPTRAGPAVSGGAPVPVAVAVQSSADGSSASAHLPREIRDPSLEPRLGIGESVIYGQLASPRESRRKPIAGKISTPSGVPPFGLSEDQVSQIPLR